MDRALAMQLVTRALVEGFESLRTNEIELLEDWVWKNEDVLGSLLPAGQSVKTFCAEVRRHERDSTFKVTSPLAVENSSIVEPPEPKQLDLDGKIRHVVEYDIVLDETQYQLYLENKQTQGTIVAGLIAQGALDSRITRWHPQMIDNLSYCIKRNTFLPEQYAQARNAMRTATSDWENCCGVQFKYCEEYDNQEDSSLHVVFTVQLEQKDQNGCLALAFFPHEPDKVLRFFPSCFSQTNLSLDGICRHELGHILGFRHASMLQHFISKSGQQSVSVMHYMHFGGPTPDIVLTDLDKERAVYVYGRPLRMFDFTQPLLLKTKAPKGALPAADEGVMGEGTTQQAVMAQEEQEQQNKLVMSQVMEEGAVATLEQRLCDKYVDIVEHAQRCLSGEHARLVVEQLELLRNAYVRKFKLFHLYSIKNYDLIKDKAQKLSADHLGLVPDIVDLHQEASIVRMKASAEEEEAKEKNSLAEEVVRHYQRNGRDIKLRLQEGRWRFVEPKLDVTVLDYPEFDFADVAYDPRLAVGTIDGDVMQLVSLEKTLLATLGMEEERKLIEQQLSDAYVGVLKSAKEGAMQSQDYQLLVKHVKCFRYLFGCRVNAFVRFYMPLLLAKEEEAQKQQQGEALNVTAPNNRRRCGSTPPQICHTPPTSKTASPVCRAWARLRPVKCGSDSP